MPGYDEAGTLFRSDSYNAALAADRCRNVEISLGVKGQSLRPSQTTVKNGNRAMGIDTVNGVKARGWASHVQSAVRRKGQVIGGNTRLQCGKNKDLPVRSNPPDGPVAIPHI